MALSHSHDSRPDAWSMPRQPLDPVMRRMAYGPIRPMAEDRARPLWHWLFGRT